MNGRGGLAARPFFCKTAVVDGWRKGYNKAYRSAEKERNALRAYERLLRYVAYPTTSDEAAPASVCPSTGRQRALANALAEELRGLGLENARVDESGYVYGTLPANCAEERPALGLIAHMDTSDAASGEGVKPRIVHAYDGGDIVLNKEKDVVLRAAAFESLKDHVGEDLIVTDGTTLLGADDKAGIAEILTALETLRESGARHGAVQIAFTPDEEIGRGADRFDVNGFGAAYAYTVDGGAIGEIEYENFNAASADVIVHGVSIHPGSAKNKMKNALRIGMAFDVLLPAHELPECTEGYEGFHHLTRMSGTEERAELHYIIRDHDSDRFARKKTDFEQAAAFLNSRYGGGTVEVALRDSYYNMKEKVEPFPFLIENAKQAMREAGIEPAVVPIRGGTDGARLSFMGLPCPNLPTGGHNFHGRFEYISIQSMDRMVDVLVRLLRV